MPTPVAYGKRKNSPTSRRKIALVKFDLNQTFTGGGVSERNW